MKQVSETISYVPILTELIGFRSYGFNYDELEDGTSELLKGYKHSGKRNLSICEMRVISARI